MDDNPKENKCKKMNMHKTDIVMCLRKKNKKQRKIELEVYQEKRDTIASKKINKTLDKTFEANEEIRKLSHYKKVIFGIESMINRPKYVINESTTHSSIFLKDHVFPKYGTRDGKTIIKTWWS